MSKFLPVMPIFHLSHHWI